MQVFTTCEYNEHNEYTANPHIQLGEQCCGIKT